MRPHVKALLTSNIEALAQVCAGAGSVEHASNCAEAHPGPQPNQPSLSMPALPGFGAMLRAVLGPVHLLMVLRQQVHDSGCSGRPRMQGSPVLGTTSAQGIVKDSK